MTGQHTVDILQSIAIIVISVGLILHTINKH